MNYDFNYLIEKIKQAEFSSEPFKHIYIENFFSPEHFSSILEAPEITLPESGSDDILFENLFDQGYKIINFPGCVNDRQTYLRWRRGEKSRNYNNSATQGFGMTLRLEQPRSPLIESLKNFIASDEFNSVIVERGGLDFSRLTSDNGVQKYLDGYEISPHPDIRRKAATFMVNINPGEDSVRESYHTHYMKFLDEYEYVREFWQENENFDRAWVPWEWCSTHFQQTENNSIVIFFPSDDTLHAIYAKYDHLPSQRTQLYGNLWFPEKALDHVPWEDLVSLPSSGLSFKQRVKNRVKRIVGARVRRHGGATSGLDNSTTTKRKY